MCGATRGGKRFAIRVSLANGVVDAIVCTCDKLHRGCTCNEFGTQRHSSGTKWCLGLGTAPGTGKLPGNWQHLKGSVSRPLMCEYETRGG